MTASIPTEVRPPSVRRAVSQFAATGLVALIVVAVAGAIVVGNVGAAASLRDSGTVAGLVAHGVIEPAVTEALLLGDPAAIDALDRVVRERVMQGTLARVKVWTPAGRIVYSDASSLIGQVFPLADDQAAALATGTMSEPQLSDLSAAENRLESSDERLVEVYVPIVAADGSSLLVESYLRPDGVLSSGRLVTEQLWPIVLAALAFLAIAQWPLAWRLATDLRVGHEARERLLRRAVDSSLAERRRIAADLHDGLVQSLAGVAYDLSGSADQAPDRATAADLQRGADGVRAAMQEARSVLVDLYPPNLAATGLATAVTDLGSNIATRGISVTTAVTDDESLGATRQAVVYRVAQEALRNVVKHSAATHVAIRLDVSHGACRLRIEDDGVGLGQVDLTDRRQAGHVGLAILHDLAREVGARLEIGPGHPRGTVLALEMGGPR